MNRDDVINYIKNHFKNMLDDKIKSIEQSIRSNTKKQYKLKDPILHKYCVINSIEEFNKLLSAENKEYINEVGEIDEYLLTLDNDFFNDAIHTSDDTKTNPIRIEKVAYKKNNEDTELPSLVTSDTIKIISIEKNSYCGYLLYEI